MIATATVSPMLSTSQDLPMDRSDAVIQLLSDIKDRPIQHDGRHPLRFCDAYAAMRSFFQTTHTMKKLQGYDEFSEKPAASLTLSLIAALQSLSEHEPAQLDFMVRLWANTLESTLRVQPVPEERSYQTFFETFLRMFASKPNWKVCADKIPYRIGTILDELIQTSHAYEETQRIVSQYYWDLGGSEWGFGFHDGYINSMTLGLSCFLRITQRHIKQRELIASFLYHMTQLNMSGLYYYDEPETIREEYMF